ncbi:reverse transcriptase domain-containing protein [Phytobacter diazotrophicus]|uniref:reverse transcriptase domain-containing protein n=1 Tax=Phytobacter diazotrophicus TaxID=395631 RepID=UPI00232FD6AF|nr:reverse transcriptase domain-containing protein [Phytobacter diazotrophicus]MDC0724791.1 reverse transcriptase domain-containing protein [Phytobacter diazotrophicus]MDC0732328.1 reverse transcriptase domain-containing protein [Phytobacter diazotrophicus]
MINAIKKEIKRLSKKAFHKELVQKKRDEKYRYQFEKRTGVNAGIPKVHPNPVSHKHFDAAYCARHANFLAKSIWYKILKLEYEPVAAINYLIPKPDGSKRSIMAFSIPDAALANVVLRRARDRNLKRLSPSSFAYHPDKNVFDAIIALNSYNRKGKLFAVQIDFEKYFDSIPSWYLKQQINDESKLSLTPHEKHIFTAFLHHKYSPHDTYNSNKHKKRITGTPQGSSISLLLANITNHDLDVALSATSGKFVRFADDVVALCDNYSQAKDIEDCFFNHCQKSGLKLNTKKSPGIAIISNTNQEMRTYAYFDYLGYRFHEDGLTIPDKTILKIKQKISRLVNLYLIYYLGFGFNPSRVSKQDGYDWDLLGLLYEIRNFLYGGLAEEDILAFINQGKRLNRMQGLMGFYCLIENPKKLKELDGWMLNVIKRAMIKRQAILISKYQIQSLTPNNIDFIKGSWLNINAWKGNDTPNATMPSFIRGWRAARKHYFTFGLETVAPPAYGHSSDIESFDSY